MSVGRLLAAAALRKLQGCPLPLRSHSGIRIVNI